MSQAEYFAELGGRYDRLRSTAGPTLLEDVIVREGGLAGLRVLDVGCGTGRTTSTWGERFPTPEAEVVEYTLRTAIVVGER